MVQLRAGNPGHSGAADWARFIAYQLAAEKLEQDAFSRIIMADGFNTLPNGDLNIQFFLQLASKALLERFSVVSFASRELPQPSQVILGASLRNEQFSVAKNQPG